jgi:formylglycine-generating enzyme required for sulfatase activity
MPSSFIIIRAGLNTVIALVCASFVCPCSLNADSIEMVYVGSGTSLVGDDSHLDDEKPTHYVVTSDYFIDVYEVNIWHWEKVATWAEKNGYRFSDSVKQRKDGSYWWYQDTSSLLFPMNMANWYDAVKWCNARSELEGRIPVYYEDANKTTVYRSGSINLEEDNVNWSATGYRLPTEVEWERAARGNSPTAGQAYSWGSSFLNGSLANYYLSGDPFDNASTPVGYFNGRQDINASENSRGGETTSHRDMANGFGLYDITGNVSEWCWDWYDAKWYFNPKSRNKNTKGPSVIQLADVKPRRVSRGGHYKSDSEGDRAGGNSLRIAYRGAHLPELGSRMRGLRCVRANVEDTLWITAISWLDFPRWYFLDWFGYYYQSQHTWVYHGDFGWIYPNGKGSYDNWIYFPQHGWLWTNRYSFPYFFSSVDSNWYEYDLLGAELGWFERFSDKAWFRWGRAFQR